MKNINSNMITFFSYYGDLPKSTHQFLLENVLSFKKPEWQNFLPEQREYIEIFFQSCRLYHPDCRSVVLSDENTPFDFPDEIDILRYPVNPETPTLARLLCQIELFKSNPYKSHYVYLDYDILLQSNLDSIFERDFDIALCCRHTHRPITVALLFVHKDSTDKAVKMLEMVKKTLLTKYPERLRWWGAQDSFRDTIGVENLEDTDFKIINFEGMNILLIPHDDYCYHPPYDVPMIDFYPDKKILHFKGHRKPQMGEYWEHYLKPR